MALGFDVGGTTGRVQPDKNLSQVGKPTNLVAKFGDGYEQRAANGINAQEENYTAVFQVRPKEEIDDIVSFLEVTQGVTPFTLTLPHTNTTGGERNVRVVYDSYTLKYQYDDFYSLDVKLRRVYEPS